MLSKSLALSTLSLIAVVSARERWLERDGRAVNLYPRRFGQENPAVIDQIRAACDGSVCGGLSGQAIGKLLAGSGECDQQDLADDIIDAGAQFDAATQEKMIAAAVEFRQAEKNTPPDFTTNPPALRNSVFCQKAPRNAQLNGLNQAQDPANDPNLFFDPASKATVQLGSQANTIPLGGSAAAAGVASVNVGAASINAGAASINAGAAAANVGAQVASGLGALSNSGVGSLSNSNLGALSSSNLASLSSLGPFAGAASLGGASASAIGNLGSNVVSADGTISNINSGLVNVGRQRRDLNNVGSELSLLADVNSNNDLNNFGNSFDNSFDNSFGSFNNLGFGSNGLDLNSLIWENSFLDGMSINLNDLINLGIVNVNDLINLGLLNNNNINSLDFNSLNGFNSIDDFNNLDLSGLNSGFNNGLDLSGLSSGLDLSGLNSGFNDFNDFSGINSFNNNDEIDVNLIDLINLGLVDVNDLINLGLISANDVINLANLGLIDVNALNGVDFNNLGFDDSQLSNLGLSNISDVNGFNSSFDDSFDNGIDSVDSLNNGVDSVDSLNNGIDSVDSLNSGLSNVNNVDSAALGDFGSCSVPQIQFAAGLEGRKETAFAPVDLQSFNHGSAQNPAIITKFICDTLVNSCDADSNAQDTCANAQQAAAAVADQKSGAVADAFNNAFGIATDFSSVQALNNQGVAV